MAVLECQIVKFYLKPFKSMWFWSLVDIVSGMYKYETLKNQIFE